MDKNKIELINLLTKINNPQLMNSFLTDLFTPAEFDEMTKRWQLIKQLHKHLPQRNISKNLGVGIATVTRGSRMLRNDQGGFNKILKKYE